MVSSFESYWIAKLNDKNHAPEKNKIFLLAKLQKHTTQNNIQRCDWTSKVNVSNILKGPNEEKTWM